MRKTAIVIVLLSTVLFACTNGAKKQDNVAAPTTNPSGITLSENKPGAVILAHNTALWVEKEKSMDFAENANLMDIFTWGGTVKLALRSSDKQEREFASIIMDDKRVLWVQSAFVAENAIPAVVVGDAVVYKKPDLASPSNIMLKNDTLLAMHYGSEQGEFVAISTYIDKTKSPALQKVWLKKNALNTKASDIYALKLSAMADVSTDAIIRTELLKNALLVDSVYSASIQAKLDALTSGDAKPLSTTGTPATTPQAAETELRTVEAFTGTFETTESTVNVRNIPNQQGSTIIAKLNLGTKVNVKSRTTKEFTVTNQTARWFQITEPEGWIFGAFVKEVQN